MSLQARDPTLLARLRLAARLHDPIEKALILMRTREGHEDGTSKILRGELGMEPLDGAIAAAVERADHWAAAADRAAFPKADKDGRYPAWQNIRFDAQPVIIHPLTGDSFDLGSLRDLEPEEAKRCAQEHYRGLIQMSGAEPDLLRTALAFWRFGPEIDDPRIGKLWGQLPADGRVPDHTIFDHLDLTAALAATLHGDDRPALFAVSLGPVQEFITAARSTSDLWAGSHLLARMSWEAMRTVCEFYGPEAIVFPRLRGVPQVDLWLRESCGLEPDLFVDMSWAKRASDANPLFIAALPNRFTALVPEADVRELAAEIDARVRAWVTEQAEAALENVLDVAGVATSEAATAREQIAAQLAGYPEVHWAAVPWSLVDTDARGLVDASSERLAEAMQPFFEKNPPGYLNSTAWQLLSRGIELESGWFYKPNPGALYPALHELLERSLAAVKAARRFPQSPQHGWRDSVTGEAEWITTERAQLDRPPGNRGDTLWSRVSERQPSWAKPGEHLGALGMLKRLWPALFVEELERGGLSVDRFVVSTHAMSIAAPLARAAKAGRAMPAELERELDASPGWAALPAKLAHELRDVPDGNRLRSIPSWLDAADDKDDERQTARRRRLLGEYLDDLEAYYALILLDGDRMGAWLSADPELSRPLADSFHPAIRAALRRFSGDAAFRRYADEKRAPSPSRHMVISEALNHFSLTLAPMIVEERHYGRILYAGGDDLMAMLPVAELLPVIGGLRAAYSGAEHAFGVRDGQFEEQGNGFIVARGKLLRTMGREATASCGAVVAHHQAPLGAVLRELRAAEKRAKDAGKRDAFSISLVKRAGGISRLTAKWRALATLEEVRGLLADPGASRRAVYNTLSWLRDLPPPDRSDGEEPSVGQEMLAALLCQQFKRQIKGADAERLGRVTQSIAELATGHAGHQAIAWTQDFLTVAEFLAREGRSIHPEDASEVGP